MGPESQSDILSPENPWKQARARFFRNVPATLGLVFLGVCLLVSVFAYLIVPDKTENANFQILELAKKPPGTSAWILLKPLTHQANPVEKSVLDWFVGRKEHFQPLEPIQEGSWVFSGDTVFFVFQSGLDGSILFPEWVLGIDRQNDFTKEVFNNTGRYYKLNGNSLEYVHFERGIQKGSLAEIKEQFLENHLRKVSFHLGSDALGRDLLSRLILGTRISLAVGFLSVLVSIFIGVTLGALAGYFRGRVDKVLMWIVSVFWSIPTLLLAVSLAFVMQKGFWQVLLAIGLSTWVDIARVVRGQIFTLREQQFVQAAHAMGFSSFRTLFRHILPNTFGAVVILGTANFAVAILIEAGLSFLGIGVKAPVPSWGGMIREGYTNIIFESGLWLAIFPGLAIIILVISLNLVGLGLRDAFDPRMISK